MLGGLVDDNAVLLEMGQDGYVERRLQVCAPRDKVTCRDRVEAVAEVAVLLVLLVYLVERRGVRAEEVVLENSKTGTRSVSRFRKKYLVRHASWDLSFELN